MLSLLSSFSPRTLKKKSSAGSTFACEEAYDLSLPGLIRKSVQPSAINYHTLVNKLGLLIATMYYEQLVARN